MQTVKMYISKNFVNQDIEASFIDNNAPPRKIYVFKNWLESFETILSTPYDLQIQKLI